MRSKGITIRILCAAGLVAAASVSWPAPGSAASAHSEQGRGPAAMKDLLSKFIGVYETPPNAVSNRIPDAPLLGNGDLAVAVDGTYHTQSFHISKSDLDHAMRGVGRVTLSFHGKPARPERYRQEQDLLHAEVRSTIPLEEGTVRMRAWTADASNVLAVEIWTEEGVPVDVTMEVQAHSAAGTSDGVIWATRQRRNGRVAIAARVLGVASECATDEHTSSTAKFTVPAGEPITVVAAVAGGQYATTHVADAVAKASELTAERVGTLHEHHRGWWEAYWSKSYIDINDELLERFYYGALYVLGSSTRAGGVAPGLAGAWHTNDSRLGRPNRLWGNNYTCNYNFQSPYWGVYSSNRAELAVPLYDVVLRCLPAARQMARRHGSRGILFGIRISPWGGVDTRTLNQKGNASLTAMNFIMHYGYTRDDQFLVDTAWPVLRELAVYWEDNLVWNDQRSRWEVHGSAAREQGDDINPINDLAYIRRIFSFLLEVSDKLDGREPAPTDVVSRPMVRPVNLGREQHGGGRWYVDGLLDDVQVFDRALSADEVKAAVAGRPVAEGLIRHWAFDEPEGEVAKDGAGQEAHGTIRGAERVERVERVEGARGRALRLDGRAGFVDCPPMAVPREFTITASVQLRSHAPAGHAQYIFSMGEWVEGCSLGISHDRLRVAAGPTHVDSSKPVPVGRWVHLAGTFDGRQLRIYIDGEQVGTDGHDEPSEAPTKYLEGGRIRISKETREQWQRYVDHLSPYPTAEFEGKVVFKEAEEGKYYTDGKFNFRGPGDNADVLMHVFPGETLSLGSSPEQLQVARNTVGALNANEARPAWFQCNNFPKLFTQAIRSGYSAEEVANRLRQMLAGEQPWADRGDFVKLMNNLAINPPIHGWESVGAIEAINSMLLQSHDGVIRVFPAWIDGKDASFTRLRAYGAFLVSSEYGRGGVSYVDITSEAGEPCRLENPWPAAAPRVFELPRETPVKIEHCRQDGTVRFATETGKQYRVVPACNTAGSR